MFFDLETTGLKNPVRITEICLVAVTRDSLLKTMKNFERLKNMSVASNKLLEEVHPRVISKISLCTKPMKGIEESASIITGKCIKTYIEFRIGLQNSSDISISSNISSFVITFTSYYQQTLDL